MEETCANGRKSSQAVLSHYKLGTTLGRGGFSIVKMAQHRLTGVKVAVKILKLHSAIDSAIQQARREINILRLLSHPHIVRLYEVIETRSVIYVVMEYMNSGELFDYITLKGRLDENEARHFFQQIISGVESCHLEKVVHRDLKPENLLLDSKGNVKIADFGLSNIMRDGHFLKKSCGSPNYAAPEVISGQLYAGPEVDVWSCGVILYALLCGRLPFDDDNLPGLYTKIKNGIYAFPNYLSLGARDLIARILIVDPVKRISIPEIHQHAWFRMHLPQYIAIRPMKSSYSTLKIDAEVVEEMSMLGFNVHEVIDSLQKSLQNKETLTYSLLLHKRFGINCKTELLESLSQGNLDRRETYVRSIPPIHGKWTLGFKPGASTNEMMRDVLDVLESLNVQWKKIGHFNLKCLWRPQASDSCTSLMEDTGNHDVRIGCASKKKYSSYDAVKFEIQIYKANAELYVLDCQRISGPPFLFLEICAGFLARGVGRKGAGSSDTGSMLTLPKDISDEITERVVRILQEDPKYAHFPHVDCLDVLTAVQGVLYGSVTPGAPLTCPPWLVSIVNIVVEWRKQSSEQPPPPPPQADKI